VVLAVCFRLTRLAFTDDVLFFAEFLSVRVTGIVESSLRLPQPPAEATCHAIRNLELATSAHNVERD
jgi:hypothetical protein